MQAISPEPGNAGPFDQIVTSDPSSSSSCETETILIVTAVRSYTELVENGPTFTYPFDFAMADSSCSMTIFIT